MSSRQCEIAAESYAACLLAQAGYDVLVQYGANQPHYDLVAVKGESLLPISVKGSQDGGWMLAVKYIRRGVGYHEAIDRWFENLRTDIVFAFVQFIHVEIGSAPRVYVARPIQVADHLKTQRGGLGLGALHEDYRREHPRSRYDHRVPEAWRFTPERIDGLGGTGALRFARPAPAVGTVERRRRLARYATLGPEDLGELEEVLADQRTIGSDLGDAEALRRRFRPEGG
jgi:hypothetical protein